MKNRSLQIEETGNFHLKKTVPKIRITGKWLAAAGFPPGGRVIVQMLQPGIIQLSHEAQSQIAGNQLR